MCKGQVVGGKDTLHKFPGPFSGHHELTHVGNIENPGILADGMVFLKGFGVIKGHLEAGEFTEPGIEGGMQGMEGQWLHGTVLSHSSWVWSTTSRETARHQNSSLFFPANGGEGWQLGGPLGPWPIKPFFSRSRQRPGPLATGNQGVFSAAFSAVFSAAFCWPFGPTLANKPPYSYHIPRPKGLRKINRRQCAIFFSRESFPPLILEKP